MLAECFILPSGFTIRPLSPADDRALMIELSDACRDFHELINGSYDAEREVEDIFLGLPPKRTLADKIVWGIARDDGRLAGVIELVRGYPDADCLWLGLLLFRPERRGAGLGVAVMSGLERWAAESGFRSLGLGVVEHNESAVRFWLSRGFVEFRRFTGVEMGERTNTLIAMKKAIS